ncbi:MAG TPA: vWA domain-containing protein [Planctomycetota bacterium]
MARQRREINIFNLSFLDVLSCGLGAVVVLFILGFYNARAYEEKVKDQKDFQDALEDARRGFQEKQKVTRRLKDFIAELRRTSAASLEKIEGLQRQVDSLQSINFVGIRTERRAILVLMDLSGSMYQEDANYARSADKLIALSQALVQSIPGEEFRFNVMGFWGGESTVDFPIFQPGFVPATPENRELGSAAIKRIVDEYGKKQGGTPTWEALDRALSMPGLEAVILITDGAPNECLARNASTGKFDPIPPAFDTFRAKVRRRNSAGVEIHCIGVGKELYGDPVFRRFLVGLSADNRGGFAAF